MHRELPFEPFPFLQNPHHQTVVGAFCNFLTPPPSEQVLLALPDGDKISLEVSAPSCWKPTDRTVLFIHGLGGSHESAYMMRLAGSLRDKGVRAVRFNMRGCGSGRRLARQLYHGGRSEDLFEAIKFLKTQHPESPLTLVGFSLGGNISLKLVGELQDLASRFLEEVIAVSPPLDLFLTVQQFGEKGSSIYERYFSRLLREDVLERHRVFKDLPPVHIPKNLKIIEFDELYTAPRSGFRSALDYYEKCSSKQVVGDIAIPCKLLFSEDDPIIPSQNFEDLIFPSHIEVYKTKKGGHMGFLSDPRDKKGVYWLNALLLEWLNVL